MDKNFSMACVYGTDDKSRARLAKDGQLIVDWVRAHGEAAGAVGIPVKALEATGYLIENAARAHDPERYFRHTGKSAVECVEAFKRTLLSLKALAKDHGLRTDPAIRAPLRRADKAVGLMGFHINMIT